MKTTKPRPQFESKKESIGKFTLRITILAVILSAILLSFTTLDKTKVSTFDTKFTRVELVTNK